ncbi:ArsR family transcriptional regulator [Testudinibacter sp. P80/BLE/0925]
MGNNAQRTAQRKKRSSKQERAERLGVDFNKGGFSTLRHDVINSPEFNALSGNSAKLLTKLLGQFNGYNNGDLTLLQNKAAELYGMSNATAKKAIDELLDSGFIITTRQGGKNRCSLYALTFIAVNECDNKIDIQPTRKPLDYWKKPR